MELTKAAKEIIESKIVLYDGVAGFRYWCEWALTNPELLAAQGLIQAQKNDDRLQWNKDAASYMQTIAALSQEIADYRQALEKILANPFDVHLI